MLPILADEAEDRLRVAEILGDTSLAGFLVRSPSSLSVAPSPSSGQPGSFAWALLTPRLAASLNSQLPYTFNDGALWAGKGLNFRIIGGVDLGIGPVRLLLAPELLYSQNSEYQVVPYPSDQDPRRSEFAGPWYYPPESVDLPTRFGRGSIVRLHAGQSSLSLTLGGVAVGVASENLWWGPGIRNALVMSSHAEGVPHLFLRPSAPVRTRIGEIDGRWITGLLSESGYFDVDRSERRRTISALAFTLRPAFEPNLTVGFTRAVQRLYNSGDLPIGAPFDVLQNIGRPNSASPEYAAAIAADQIFSFFARWVFPESGFESYVEWARLEQPASLRDFLIAPNHSQAYTLGLQWARETTIPAVFRVQAEASYLEPSSTFKQRPVLSAYSSQSVPQGYTHRGQVLGASIGPGASSQWFGADLLAEGWRGGLFIGRIRWNEGVLPRTDLPDILRHEISTIAGVRGGGVVRGVDVHAELALEGRLNYQFQNPIIGLENPEGVDIRNTSLRLVVTP